MSAILDFILVNMRTHAFLTILLGGFVEQIIIPIPSPMISMAGGALFSQDPRPFWEALVYLFGHVSVPYALGAVVGNAVIYTIAYKGGETIVTRFGKFIGISWKLVEKIQKDLKKNTKDELFLAIAFAIPVFPVSLITGFAGLVGIKPRSFFPSAFLGFLLRGSILSIIGFQMGQTYFSLMHGMNLVENIFTIIGIVAVLGFFYWQRFRWMKKNS